ncbi:hypothetical protein EXVG_00409 [Emiliania huxleyi virus 202]|nr:hypothetical protein EXVG_00409 [Emiliania huxleyi virus 202]AHA54367.1 hypothetical protein EhV18_00321 [Emiliania huxleyi virus 18]AHA55406.1 hypothetical protein EhV156_00311 [Emiliania huxleyi virus 156]
MFIHSWQGVRVRNTRSVPYMRHSSAITRSGANNLRTYGQRVLYTMRQRAQSGWGATIGSKYELATWAKDTELVFRNDLLDDFVYYGFPEDHLRKKYSEMLAFIHMSLEDMTANNLERRCVFREPDARYTDIG